MYIYGPLFPTQKRATESNASKSYLKLDELKEVKFFFYLYIKSCTILIFLYILTVDLKEFMFESVCERKGYGSSVIVIGNSSCYSFS